MSGSDPLRDNAYGIDVSHWQDTTPSLAGLDFVFARATIGTHLDETYDTHIGRAKRAGLVTGAYHFGDFGTSATAQARAFLEAAGDVDFYVLDHEGARRMLAAGAKAFIRAVQATGKKCGLYASLSGFPDFGQDYNWIALWASNPPANRSWAFWQFGGSSIDHDVFHGTAAELRAFAGYAQGDPVGINLTFIEPPEFGMLTIPAAVDAQSVATGEHAPARSGWAIQRWGVKVRLDDGGEGYVVDLTGGHLYFIRKEQPVLFTKDVPPADTTPFDQAALDAALAEGLAQADAMEAAARSEGAASERERIATIEANRIRGL